MEHFGWLCSMMFKVFVYILYGIGAVQSSTCVPKRAVFQAVKVLEGYNITLSILDVLSRNESMTRIGCADQCSTLDDCLSFFHNSITSQCQFHTEVFLENTGAAAQAGTVYFYRVGKEVPTEPFHCPTEDGFQMLGSDEMCVKFHTDKKTFSDATATCARYSPNGHVVVVDTEAKNKLVIDAAIAIKSEFSGAIFIGLTIDGWVDSSPLVYGSNISFTAESECTKYYKSRQWAWYITKCNNSLHYICQI